jgi:predicted transcriptional regulator
MTDRNPAHDDTGPAVQDVLRALDDEACRTILAELSEPMTANDLRDSCDIPKSTLYRKLDLLSQAALVHERTQIVADGGRRTRYDRDVSAVTVSITDDDTFAVSMDRVSRSADERLADLWSDMGEEL